MKYDVFLNFCGEDVRGTFLDYFLQELERKLIITFKDNKLERSQNLTPELVLTIKESRIAVVVFSRNYASSISCLDELLYIVQSKEEYGQIVIPIFYGLDPSHVRKQTGEFGKNFEKTCKNVEEDRVYKWRRALCDVANILGYHSRNWANEATMIEKVANDVLVKLNLTPSSDFSEFVGIEDHIAAMSSLLKLESEEVRMVGIWGPSGIGKTTIARALFIRLSLRFQSSIFIDRAFVSKNKEFYSRANVDDYNMKLHLQESFLSEILGKKDIKIDHLGALGERLKHQRVLIIIDDLDDQWVLDTLVGQPQWFESTSRIVVVTNDRQLLRAHGINHIYEVCLPSEKLSLEMLSRFAFRQNSRPESLVELASEFAMLVGYLPLGLNVLGSYLRGMDKEGWMDMLSRIGNDLDGKIEKTLRVNYDGLNNKKDQSLFRHIACLFNGENVFNIKQLLVGSNFDVNNALRNLIDKSLIQVNDDTVKMQRLLQEMGKEIVRSQSYKPGKREFLVDSNDICDVLADNTGTKKVLGIALDMDEIDDLHIHASAFKGMCNILFLKFFTKKEKEVRWHFPEGFDYLPHKLRLLSWEIYPLRCMPSNFRPENLVKLQLRNSKLEKLWDGVHSLTKLKEVDLGGSEELKEIPDLSMATNLKKLDLSYCSSLVELPCSIQYLNKLEELQMEFCKNLVTLPIGINLVSLYRLNLNGCSRLRSFPDISANISHLYLCETTIDELPAKLRLKNLVDVSIYGMKSERLGERVLLLTPLMTMLPPSLMTLSLSDIPSLVELPSSIQNLHKLEHLTITNCTNLETLPTGINLEFLTSLCLRGCSRLRNFPDISTNMEQLYLSQTGIEEVPQWIEKFSRLIYLTMSGCNNLQCVSLNIYKLENLETVDFSDCRALSLASWDDSPSAVAMATDSSHSKLPEAELDFRNCFNLDQEALLQQQTVFNNLFLSGGEVPSYFTYRTTGTSLTSIPLLHIFPCQPLFRFRACALFDSESVPMDFPLTIQICCRFTYNTHYYFDSPYQHKVFWEPDKGSHMVIFDCCFPLDEDNASLVEGNYNNVDIQFNLFDEFKVKGCGIRPFEDGESSDDDDLGNETDCSGEWIFCNDSDIGTETDHSEECEDNDVKQREAVSECGYFFKIKQKLLAFRPGSNTRCHFESLIVNLRENFHRAM